MEHIYGSAELIAERKTEWFAEGERNNKALATVKNFIAMGFPIEQIALGTGLSVEEVKSLR